MPNPNTTFQLIKETRTTLAAKPGPKSERAAGPACEAASGARSCGAGRALPPQRPRRGAPMRASPTQQQPPCSAWPWLVPTCSLGSQRQLPMDIFPKPIGFRGNFHTCTHRHFLRPQHLHPAVASPTLCFTAK